MGKICWNFPLLGTGNKQGYTNAGIAVFEGSELMDNLAREICQNSLDAKSEKTDEPVKVEFKLKQLNFNNYPLFEDFKTLIVGCKEYWQNRAKDQNLWDFLGGVDKIFLNDKIPVMVISDYNTKGLTGIKANDEESVWETLTNSDGISVKTNEDSGGSYGVGKNAPFACSNLSMVFYNTVAEDGESAFQGVARVATLLNADKKPTQSIGKYLYIEDDESEWHPIYPSETCKFRDEFKRDSTGTDIIIVGFKLNDEINWQDAITKAIIRNFIVAIEQKKLEILVDDISITQETLPTLLNVKFKDDSELHLTKEYYLTLTRPDVSEDYSVLETNDVSVYVKFQDDFSKTTSYFRSTGMLIESYKKSTLQHFSAIVKINNAGEKQLNKLLRATEPQRHNQWDPDRIKNDLSKKKQAKKVLKQLKKIIQDILDKNNQFIVADYLDGDVGEYLPNSNIDSSTNNSGDDKLKVNLKIKSFKDSSGRKLMGNKYDHARSATGEKTEGNIHRSGEKKNKRKKKLKVVKTGEGNKKGLTIGKESIKITIPEITTHRTFQVTNQIYKLFIEAPNDLDNIYIKCSAARDDNKEDTLKVISYTQNNIKTLANSSKIGPLNLSSEKENEVYLEFDLNETMALSTVITREVDYEQK